MSFSVNDRPDILAVSVAGRASPLSLAQIQEVFLELRRFEPRLRFDIRPVSVIGDRDQVTSLRSLGQTDFFTREIDLLILSGECRIGIHSAKDLADPLHPSLAIFCLTRGVDSSDVLVLREGETLETLPPGAVVATSSLRREENAILLRKDFAFKDIRGTIASRLNQLKNGTADGVIVAEAALIRLGLTHLNRIRLPGPVAAGQGRLAVVGSASDREMQLLFGKLSSETVNRSPV